MRRGSNYSNSDIPLISSISSDGDFVVCVKLTDSVGNITYGKSATVTRDISAPSFVDMALANEAVGGYINDLEKTAADAIYTLDASGQSSDDFTAAVASTTTCNVAQTYSNSDIPLISSISSDGDWVVCVKLTDSVGNISYGKSATGVSRYCSSFVYLS